MGVFGLRRSEHSGRSMIVSIPCADQGLTYDIVHALASVVTELAIEIVKAGQDGHDDRTEELSHTRSEGDPEHPIASARQPALAACIKRDLREGSQTHDPSASNRCRCRTRRQPRSGELDELGDDEP